MLFRTSEDKVDQNLIQCYVTICAVPSLQPCKTCAEVAAARAEEAQNSEYQDSITFIISLPLIYNSGFLTGTRLITMMNTR